MDISENSPAALIIRHECACLFPSVTLLLDMYSSYLYTTAFIFCLEKTDHKDLVENKNI